MTIQIGLSPVYVYIGGIIIFGAFLVQTTLAQRRRQYVLDLCRDLLVCYVRQRGGTVFLGEVGLAWGDFVTDLAIALSVKFPNLALFVLMWIFLGAQLLPYTLLVFAIHCPSGWLLRPFNFMFDLGLLTGLKFVIPAAHITVRQAQAYWYAFHMMVQAAWAPGEFVTLSAICMSIGRIIAISWCVAIGLTGASIALVLAILSWSITLVFAILCAVTWILVWVVWLSIEITLRTVLFAFGFLLYVAQMLSFPEAPMTQVFFTYWCTLDQQATNKNEMRLDLETSPEVPIFDLSHQGVNIFRLHTTYIFEFVLESIAQLVIQILIASLGEGWSIFVVVSVAFSAIVIVFFLSRYFYWLVIRPNCNNDLTVRQSLIDMHLYYYHIADETD